MHVISSRGHLTALTHRYGQGSGKQPSVFGAGAAALMNPFGFGRSGRSLGTISEKGNAGTPGSSSTWLEDAKSRSGAGSLFVYKGFRTLSYSPSLRAMGALALPDDEQPVPRPQISKHLDRYAHADANGANGGPGSAAGDGGAGADADELISPLRHATLSLSGLDLVRTRQSSSNVDPSDFPATDGKEGGEEEDASGHEVVGCVHTPFPCTASPSLCHCCLRLAIACIAHEQCSPYPHVIVSAGRPLLPRSCTASLRSPCPTWPSCAGCGRATSW